MDISARLNERRAQLRALEDHTAFVRGQVAELEAIEAALIAIQQEYAYVPPAAPAAARPAAAPDGA